MADNEQDFLQMGVTPEMYEALDRDFKEVLQSMVGEKSLERFRVEYEKLHRALKSSVESGNRLHKQAKDLQEIINNNAARVKAAIKLTQEDSATIGLLKKEVDKAWKLVDTAKDKEEKAKKIIAELRVEIAQLNKTVELGSGLHFSQDNTVQVLMQKQEGLTNEIREKEDKLLAITEQKQQAEDRAAKLDADLTKEREMYHALMQSFDAKKEEHLREQRQKTSLETSERELKQKILNKDAQLKTSEELAKSYKATIESLEAAKTDLNEQITDLDKKNRMEIAKYESLKKEHEQTKREKDKREKELDTLKSDHIDLKGKNHLLKNDNQRFARLNSDLNSQNKRLEDAKFQAVQEKTVATNSVSALTREIEWLRKQADEDRRKLEGLESKKEKFKSNLDQIQNKITNMENQAKQDAMEIENLKQAEIANKNVNDALSKETIKLEQERDKFSIDAAKANSNLLQTLEEVKLKRNLISELTKVNLDLESKLKTQQNLYEAVRSERNLYSKNLVEAQDQVNELKRKFRIAQHSIDQLKEEITAKAQALTATHHDLGTAKKDAEKNKSDMQDEKNAKLQLKAQVDQLNMQETKLSNIIKDAYAAHEEQRKQITKLQATRDALGTQLIRRNDELALLYEKIKILQTTLNKGEAQYQQRLADIKILNYSIADLKCELRIVKSQAEQIDNLRNEIINLDAQLIKEKLSVKALSEELENPLNIHRWRKLEGTDPDTWEMLQKIQTLQKRLIKKTEEVVEKDVIIQEKEKLYVELKNLLARQPGPEVAEQLSIYQQNLKEKTNQMKAMAAELNMYQAQVNEYKYEIERLTRELQEMKRRYYEQKRREQNHKEAQQRANGQGYTGIQAQTGPQQRFTGGGFNLAI